jgi:hypothetical protein
MILQVLVAEKTVAQLEPRLFDCRPRLVNFRMAGWGAVLSHEADRGIVRLPPPYRAPRHLPRCM